MSFFDDLLDKFKKPTPKPEPKLAPVIPISQPEKIVVADTYAKPKAGSLNQEGIELLKFFEGFRSKPYLDTANPPVPTIGYGSTYYEDGTKVTMQDAPIDEARASSLFNTIVKRFEKEVMGLTTGCNLNDNQISALTAFAYNIGVGNLSTSTLLKLIKSGDFNGASDQFPRWDKSGGKVTKGLVIRRFSERALFRGEDWRVARDQKTKELG